MAWQPEYNSLMGERGTATAVKGKWQPQANPLEDKNYDPSYFKDDLAKKIDEQRQQQEQQKADQQKQGKQNAVQKVGSFLKDAGKSFVNTAELPYKAGEAVAKKALSRTGAYSPEQAQQSVDNLKKTYHESIPGSIIDTASKGEAMLSSTPLNPGPTPQKIVDKEAQKLYNEAIKHGKTPDDAETLSLALKTKGYKQIFEKSGIGPNDSSFTIGRKAVGNFAQNYTNALTLGSGGTAEKSVAEGVAEGAAPTLKALFKSSAKQAATLGPVMGVAQTATEDKPTLKSLGKNVVSNAVFAGGIPLVTGLATHGISRASAGAPKSLHQQEIESQVKEATPPPRTVTETPSVNAVVDKNLVKEGAVKPDITYEPINKLKAGAGVAGPVDEARVAEYAQDIKKGKPIEPLVVTRRDGGTFVEDGKHRLAAMQEAGIKDIPVVEKGTGKGQAITVPEKNRFTKLSDYSNKLYHETSSANANDLLLDVSGGHATDIHVANSPELALGQGGKGVKITFDGKETVGKFVEDRKPGADFLHKQGKTDSLKIAQGNNRSVLSVEMPKESFNKLDGGVTKSALRSAGLDTENPKVLANGNLLFERPGASASVNTKAEPLKPIGEGATKTPKLASSVAQKAVDKKLTDSLGDLPEYKSVNMADQAKKSTELLATDEARAIRIASGKEAPPGDILPEAVFTAVENKALQDGNVELLRQLATSTRATEATAMGQRIAALAQRDPDSVVSAIRKVADARAKAFEGKLKGTTTEKAVTATASEIKSAVRTPTKMDWNSFVESLRC